MHTSSSPHASQVAPPASLSVPEVAELVGVSPLEPSLAVPELSPVASVASVPAVLPPVLG